MGWGGGFLFLAETKVEVECAGHPHPHAHPFRLTAGAGSGGGKDDRIQPGVAILQAGPHTIEPRDSGAYVNASKCTTHLYFTSFTYG